MMAFVYDKNTFFGLIILRMFYPLVPYIFNMKRTGFLLLLLLI